MVTKNGVSCAGKSVWWQERGTAVSPERHSEAERDGRDAEQEIRIPREEDRARDVSGPETRIEEQERYVYGICYGHAHVCVPPLAALNALKRKKRLEKQLNQMDGTISTIEFQREALENAQTNTEVLKNMGFAAKALKAAHQHL